MPFSFTACKAAAWFWFGFLCVVLLEKVQVFIAAHFMPKEATDHTSRTTGEKQQLLEAFRFLGVFKKLLCHHKSKLKQRGNKVKNRKK